MCPPREAAFGASRRGNTVIAHPRAFGRKTVSVEPNGSSRDRGAPWWGGMSGRAIAKKSGTAEISSSLLHGFCRAKENFLYYIAVLREGNSYEAYRKICKAVF